MPLVFELGFPLLWCWLGYRLWRSDRWQATLFVSFYFVCLICEAVAIRFGEYFYGPLQVAICPPGPLLRAAGGCPQPDLCLPLAVPCMEGALFFAGYVWATRREAAPALRPLAGALLAVVADLIFDPVAARGQLCAAGGEVLGSWDGIGLWTWLLDPADPGSYFGIPVDNALAWLASCLGFGYAALLVPRWRKKDPLRLGAWARIVLAAQVSLAGLLLAGLLFAILDLLVTPPGTGQTYRLAMLFIVLGGLYTCLLGRAWHRATGEANQEAEGGTPSATGFPPSPRRRGGQGGEVPCAQKLDNAATLAMAASLAYALVALLLGYDRPELYPLWLLVAAALAAYWAAISRTPCSIRRTISGRPSSETEQIARRR